MEYGLMIMLRICHHRCFLVVVWIYFEDETDVLSGVVYLTVFLADWDPISPLHCRKFASSWRIPVSLTNCCCRMFTRQWMSTTIIQGKLHALTCLRLRQRILVSWVGTIRYVLYPFICNSVRFFGLEVMGIAMSIRWTRYKLMGLCCTSISKDSACLYTALNRTQVFENKKGLDLELKINGITITFQHIKDVSCFQMSSKQNHKLYLFLCLV